MRDSEPYKIGYIEGFTDGFTDGFTNAMELANALSLSDEQQLFLARKSLDYLPFPRIIELLGLSVSQAKKILAQAEFEEYVKDEFDLFVEEDGFFSKEDMEGIYQYRLKLAKGDIEDTPVQEIITDSKILLRDLNKLLIEYIEEQEKAGSKDEGKGERE